MSDLADFLDWGWSILLSATGPGHPAGIVALATVDERRPQVRFVVLRAADPAQGWLEVHTDLRTPKVRQLRDRPEASLVAWSAEDRLQVRASGRVVARTGDEVAPIWDRVATGSRQNYGIRPDPGHPIGGPHDYRKPPDRERFAVLRLEVEHLDLVHLSERHRRASFDRADGFAGTWLAP